MSNYPRDITYCDNKNCRRNCERRLDNKNFQGVISISRFEDLTDDVDKCENYMEEYYANR